MRMMPNEFRHATVIGRTAGEQPPAIRLGLFLILLPLMVVYWAGFATFIAGYLLINAAAGRRA